MPFPDTSINLLSRLKASDGSGPCQVSWKRFLELYHEALLAFARTCYWHSTHGDTPPSSLMEEAVANTVADFYTRGVHRYDPQRGKLRHYLRMLVNARVIDLLRKECPLDHLSLDEKILEELPEETEQEKHKFFRALQASLVEDLRSQIPMRRFEIFERVKLKSQSAQFVAEDIGISRARVDREIHKAMTSLREIASHPDYQQEFYDFPRR